MQAKDDFYFDYTRQRDIRLVKDLARYLCDRFPQSYSQLLLEVCKMYCNQKYDTNYEIDESIKMLPFILKLER